MNWYAKVGNEYMKDCDKNEESSYLNYWDLNNWYGWAIPQRFPVNEFKWAEETPQLKDDFIKSYNEKSRKGYFLEVDAQYPEDLHDLHNHLLFLPERMKTSKKWKISSKFTLNQGLNHWFIKSWINTKKGSQSL